MPLISWTTFLKKIPHNFNPIFFLNNPNSNDKFTVANVSETGLYLIINTFQDNVIFFYSLETSENKRFSNVFRGYGLSLCFWSEYGKELAHILVTSFYFGANSNTHFNLFLKGYNHSLRNLDEFDLFTSGIRIFSPLQLGRGYYLLL